MYTVWVPPAWVVDVVFVYVWESAVSQIAIGAGRPARSDCSTKDKGRLAVLQVPQVRMWRSATTWVGELLHLEATIPHSCPPVVSDVVVLSYPTST